MAAIILGCSPGTQGFGLAVIRNDVLVDWDSLSFRGKWSRDKLDGILIKIEELIHIYGIEQVAVKIPDTFPTAMPYNQLIGSLNLLFEGYGMNVHYFTLRELKEHCKLGTSATKETIADFIVHRHSELRTRYTPHSGKPTKHQARVFEAICAAHTLHTRSTCRK